MSGGKEREIGMGASCTEPELMQRAQPDTQCAWQNARTAAQRRIWNTRAEDDVIVARFQAGDSTAFGQLVEKYQHRLMRVVSRLIHNQADAEDIVQEAFIRAYRALPEFRGEAAVYTWLFTIAMNAAKNFRVTAARKADVWVQPDVDDHDEELPVSVDLHTPVAELEAKQLVVAFNKLIDVMPEHLSMPLILRELEGMSYEDIAATMECPIGTVRSRIFRARELIMVKLSPLLDSQLTLNRERA
jgi:RNA polymerase sigma-70 factor (ECF subfamily)